MNRKLPIGIQGFEKLREEQYLYVDKTALIYRLVHDSVPFFLSRPRRFGKSLLLSTMKAYWEGKRDLFADLAIEKMEEGNPNAWQSYPVFYFDFNGVNYQESGSLERKLDFQLQQWEETYLSLNCGNTLGERFQKLLKKAKEKTGLRCVVLVDEYDKPLLDVIENKELQEHNKEVFKGFFSTLKSFDEYIQFVFITGVTKFQKVSIFSDLNHLKDISLSEEFADLCGITEAEIFSCFSPEVSNMAEKREMSVEECMTQLKKQYDGYHFHPDAPGVYNPFSLLNAFYDKEFGSYWYETGTPTFLVKKLKESRFDLRKLTDGTLYASEGMLKDYSDDSLSPIPLLYQAGYLTIMGYESRKKRYALRFPNEEVEYGFLESLMPVYAPNSNYTIETD